MCCCCEGGGPHGRWGHGHGHGPWHEHGPEGSGPHDRWHEREERPPERGRGGECGCGRDQGETFNWNESYPFGFRRHFHARGEELEILRQYLDGLEKEAAAVREVIAQAEQPPEPPAPPPPGEPVVEPQP